MSNILLKEYFEFLFKETNGATSKNILKVDKFFQELQKIKKFLSLDRAHYSERNILITQSFDIGNIEMSCRFEYNFEHKVRMIINFGCITSSSPAMKVVDNAFCADEISCGNKVSDRILNESSITYLEKSNTSLKYDFYALPTRSTTLKQNEMLYKIQASYFYRLHPRKNDEIYDRICNIHINPEEADWSISFINYMNREKS